MVQITGVADNFRETQDTRVGAGPALLSEGAIKLPEQASRDMLAQRRDEASSVVRIWLLGSLNEGVTPSPPGGGFRSNKAGARWKICSF